MVWCWKKGKCLLGLVVMRWKGKLKLNQDVAQLDINSI